MSRMILEYIQNKKYPLYRWFIAKMLFTGWTKTTFNWAIYSCTLSRQQCTLHKTIEQSSVYVTWQGNLRLIHTGSAYGACARWYFTFNGQECDNPDTIEGVEHIRSTTENLHFPTTGIAFLDGKLTRATNKYMYGIFQMKNLYTPKLVAQCSFKTNLLHTL